MPGLTIRGSVVVVLAGNVVVVDVVDVGGAVVAGVVVLGGVVVVGAAWSRDGLLQAVTPTASRTRSATRRANDRWATGGVLITFPACPLHALNSSHPVVSS
jgi:hypothetical protein